MVGERRLPRLPGALLWVACELRDLIDGGDHLILTGNVLAADSRDGHPLLFHRGAYRDLLAESGAGHETPWRVICESARKPPVR